MNSRLVKTLNEYNKPLNGYEFIDGYNQIIRDDGVAGTITTRVNESNHIFVVVEDNEQDNRNIRLGNK